MRLPSGIAAERIECANTITEYIRNLPGPDSVLCDCTTRVQTNEHEYYFIECVRKHTLGVDGSIVVKHRVYPTERRVDSNSSFGL
jgi:copper chaperone CopZ